MRSPLSSSSNLGWSGPGSICVEVEHVHRLWNMQRARAAPIVDAIGDIAVLLDFSDQRAGTQRMDRSAGHKDDIARFDG